ncbi:MAG TPA: M23 family metallopeptidase, partial [Myxococcaceae bacterium]
MNGIAVSTPLSVGQVLIIPAPAAPAVSEGESADAQLLPPALAAAFETAGSARAEEDAPGPSGRAAPPAGRDGHGPGRIESSVLGAMPHSQVAKTRQLQWPLRGVLYARFGRKGKSPHDGIDLAAPAGTPVRTAGEGSVLFAGPQQGYGLLVIIEHAHGLVTVYAHNRDLRVRTGQQIREGQVIATVGESGKTSGPHLHFEVRQDGAPVDPLEILGPPPAS